MNEYLIVFQYNNKENKTTTTSQTYPSKLPLCHKLIDEIFGYIRTNTNSENFALMNIICLSNKEEQENKKLKKQFEYTKKIIRFLFRK